MKKKLLFVVLCAGLPLLGWGQKVMNPDFRQVGKEVQVKYDLTKKAKVSVLLVDSAGVEHQIKALRGDVGRRVKKGMNRTVIWSPLDEVGLNPALLNSDVRFKIKAKMPYRTFFMFDGFYDFADSKEWMYGLTLGGVGHVMGWYITAQSSFTFYKHDAMLVSKNEMKNYLFAKEDGRWFNLQGTAGLVIRLGCPLAVYGGVGMGWREVQAITTDGRWITLPPDMYGSNYGVAGEFGLMLHGSGVCLRAGLSKVSGDAHFALNFGFGFVI